MAFGTKKTVATPSFSERMQIIFMQKWRRRLRTRMHK